jgi:hypothetical protein
MELPTVCMTRALAAMAILCASIAPAWADVPTAVDTGILGGESSIALSPSNPANLVVGSNDQSRTGCHVAYSLDRGASWGAGGDAGLLPGLTLLPNQPWPINSASDPAVAVDRLGRFYYSCIAFSNLGFSIVNLTIVVSRSDDGGRTWEPVPTVVAQGTGTDFNDKDYLAVDATGGPRDGSVYVAWARFGCVDGPGCPHPIWLRRSVDRGDTWLPAVRVSDDDSAQGSAPAVGPNGEVYVAFAHFPDPDSAVPDRIVIDRSLDGGATFGTDVVVANIPGVAVRNERGRNSFPTIAVDRSQGPNRGTIYLAWAQMSAGGDAEIVLASSRDGGTTWSAPRRVVDDAPDNGRDQSLPWVSTDARGRLDVVFADRRNDPQDSLDDFYQTWSTDGGASFATNRRLTDHPSWVDTSTVDYIGAVADEKSFFSVWPFDPPYVPSDAPVHTSELLKAVTVGRASLNAATGRATVKGMFVLSPGTTIDPPAEGFDAAIVRADGTPLWQIALPADCNGAPCLQQTDTSGRHFRFSDASGSFGGINRITLASKDYRTWKARVKTEAPFFGAFEAGATLTTVMSIGEDTMTDTSPTRLYRPTLLAWKWKLPK